MVVLSIGGDHKDLRFPQLAKNIRYFVFLPVISPNDPNLAARRCLGEHFIRSVLALLKAENVLKRRLYFIGGKRVGVNFLEVPVNPLELPHARLLYELYQHSSCRECEQE